MGCHFLLQNPPELPTTPYIPIPSTWVPTLPHPDLTSHQWEGPGGPTVSAPLVLLTLRLSTSSPGSAQLLLLGRPTCPLPGQLHTAGTHCLPQAADHSTRSSRSSPRPFQKSKARQPRGAGMGLSRTGAHCLFCFLFFFFPLPVFKSLIQQVFIEHQLYVTGLPRWLRW